MRDQHGQDIQNERIAGRVVTALCDELRKLIDAIKAGILARVDQKTHPRHVGQSRIGVVATLLQRGDRLLCVEASPGTQARQVHLSRRGWLGRC